MLMGTGNHGGFGNTAGSDVRYRKGVPVPITPKTLEMSLNPLEYASAISQKYKIHLKGSGQKVIIKYDPDLPMGIYGKTYKKTPNVIYVGPNAFASESELATTIAHELNHARSYLKGRRAPEKTARKSEKALKSYIGGKR